MHNNWEEMLPFYIAGTLPRNETTRLENHLSRCDDCRRSLDEWRLIADVVRADAASQMRALPPLSGQVLRLAAQQASGRSYQPIPSASYAPPRYGSTSVMLVAAFLTVVLFGALLGFMVLRGALPQPDMSIANLPTATAAATDVPSPTAVPGTSTPHPQIVLVEPSATPVSPTPILPSPSPTLIPPTRRSPTAVLPPTVIVPTTAPPASATPLLPSPLPPSATTVPSQTPIPPSATSQPQIIVVEPSAAPVVPTSAPLTIIQPTQAPPTEVIPSFEAQLFAEVTPDAERFSLQAPALKTTCMIQGVIAGGIVNLYAGPGEEYPILNVFTQDDELTALAQSDSGWIRAQYSFDEVGTWVGWVRADLVFLSGECADLPLILSSEATADVPPAPETTDESPGEVTPESDATADPPAVVITASVANLRTGPGTGYTIVAAAHAGDRFPVTAQTSAVSGIWYLVQRSSQPAVWVAASVARLTPPGAFVSPALTVPPPASTTATDLPFAADEIASGSWSQTTTVLSTACAATPASGGAASVSLSVSGDAITLSSPDPGVPFVLQRIGEQTYAGSYVTASASVSVSVTFASPTSYSGSAVATAADGCITQSAWSGIYVGS